MIALWLIVAHLAGDFLLQDRWEAAGKLTDGNLRARHVLKYAVPFVPVAFVYARSPWFGWQDGLSMASLFLAGLIVLHYLTDSRRFVSTVGDWLSWRFMRRITFPWRSPFVTLDHPEVGRVETVTGSDLGEIRMTGTLVSQGKIFATANMDLRPNPWPPISIMIDQSLHLLQIAVLAAVFLR